MTLQELIELYCTDSISGFHALRFSTRKTQNNLMNRIIKQFGHTKLEDIKGRTLLEWYNKWAEGGHYSNAHALVKKLRTIFTYGMSMLEDPEATRVRLVMKVMRFQGSPQRQEIINFDQARAIIIKAGSKSLKIYWASSGLSV